MKVITLFGAILLLTSNAFAGEEVTVKNNAPYHLVRTPSQRVRATSHIEITPTQEIQQWLPVAAVMRETPRQREVSTTLTFAGIQAEAKQYQEKDGLKRPYLFADIAFPSSRFEARLSYEATLYRTRLVGGSGSQKVEELEEKQRTLYTQPTPALDFDKAEFKRWKRASGLTRKQGEPDLDYARRIFMAVTRWGYERSFTEVKASELVEKAGRRTHCGGLSILFVACLREAGIPARTLYGRYALPAPSEEARNYFFGSQIHTKAEFWLEEVGWIPVELAAAVGCSTTEAEKYFGNDEGNFLTLHEEDSLRITLGSYGPRVLYSAQVLQTWTNPAGSWASQTREEWIVEKLPLLTASSQQ